MPFRGSLVSAGDFEEPGSRVHMLVSIRRHRSPTRDSELNRIPNGALSTGKQTPATTALQRKIYRTDTDATKIAR